MTPHLHLEKNESHASVIVCGSPERAAVFASQLIGSKCIAQNREYHSYLGRYQDHEILVTSHGVGAAGAAICFHELIDAGARVIIRVGTAGGLTDESAVGDIVVATSAVRNDGVSRLMIPESFPAVADFEVSGRLIQNMKAQGWRGHCGTVVSTDLFYPGLLENQLPLYKAANAVAVEMECSALFIIGQLRRVKTGALLVLDGNPLKWNQGEYNPRSEMVRESLLRCFQAAVQAVL